MLPYPLEIADDKGIEVKATLALFTGFPLSYVQGSENMHRLWRQLQ